MIEPQFKKYSSNVNKLEINDIDKVNLNNLDKACDDNTKKVKTSNIGKSYIQIKLSSVSKEKKTESPYGMQVMNRRASMKNMRVENSENNAKKYNKRLTGHS